MARVRSEAYDDRRQEFLDEAARLFARHGFAWTSNTAPCRRSEGAPLEQTHLPKSASNIGVVCQLEKRPMTLTF